MRQKFELLAQDIAEISRKMEAAKAKRIAVAPTVLADINATLAQATPKLTAAQEKLAAALKSEQDSQRLWPSTAVSDALKKEVALYQTIVDKLSKTKELVAKVSNEDVARANKILQLQTDVNNLIRLLTGSETEATLKGILAKIELHKQHSQELYLQIMENEKRISLYQQIAQSYDNANPERFADHWLEVANVILERQDLYGFTGEILYRDLGTTKTANTGLELTSVSYGAVLKDDQMIQYTYPNSKIKIEHDATGRITDRSVFASQPPPITEEMNLAALKCAKLLLMDCMLKKDPKMFIRGPESSLQQTLLIIAAVRTLAEEAGITLPEDAIDVQVMGWLDWKNTTEYSETQIQAATPGIKALITTKNATGEFKELYSRLNSHSSIVKEEIVITKPPSTPTP